jgi:iron complex outermembrane recepter protein
MYGQATPAPTAADLAKYDKNKNGVLDPDELLSKAKEEAAARDTILMNPFNVSTDKDVGYTAGNTLSGGRVDTPLAITPGSISVMTKEFMEDFNITDMNQAGSWSIGFDLGTAVPNSDPSSISVYQNIVRGAPSTDNFPTRNGSINFGAADSYNTERFEFNRGPDTAMFGDGGPGGRQGSSSKQATFNRSSTSVSLQADNWNGYRATVDYSKGWDRFGVRFNALTQNAPGYQTGMNKLKKAWTINTVTKLTKNTQFVAEYERTNEWNNLWSITNGDAQLSWDSLTINDNNSALLANSNTALNAVGLERVTVGANGGAANMFVYNYAYHDMQDYGGNQYRTRNGPFGPNMRIPYGGNPYVLAIPARRSPVRGIDPKFSAAAKDNIAARDADTFRLNLEQRVGNLFVRLGYVRNSFDNNTVYSNTSPNAYTIDVNKLRPDGSLNRKYLSVFTDVEQSNAYSQDAMQEYSGLATYRFFKPSWWDYKQQISVNVSHRNQQSENANRAWRRIDNPTSTNPFNNENKFFYRVYWDEPRADHAPILTNPNGKVPGAWKYIETGGGITERTVDHGGITTQSAFFNEKLAITLSYSKDNLDVDNLPRVGGAAINGSTGAPDYLNVLGFNSIPGNHFLRKSTKSSSSAGIVTYPFQFKRDGFLKKYISPIGFVFNFAQNNQPPGTNTQSPLIDGTEPPPPHSQTKDFGLRYSVPGGKAYFTLSHYNTDQDDNPSGFQSGGNITAIWTNLGYTDPALTTTTLGSGFNYSDPSSRKLEGWEAELTANPTRNISLSINYSHPITYIAKESVDRIAYVAEHRAEWEAGAAAASGAVLNGHTIVDPTLIASNLASIDNSLAGLTTGTLENGATRHRINASGRYRFSEGMLKGLAVNAGVQYRSHTKSGSRDTRIKFNIPDNVNPTTVQNTAAAWDYLWAPPSWKSTIVAGANYTRRFGKYNYRFQLNVNNVLNNLDPIWGRSGPAGTAYNVVATNAFNAGNARTQFLYSFVNPEPRKFTFTTTVSF